MPTSADQSQATAVHPAFGEDQEARHAMVERQLVRRGIRDTRVLDALRTVPRHAFVPHRVKHLAYRDHPLPIGMDQTISQPYIVAIMSESLALKPGERVLEIGTGSGYQAAILAEMNAEVYTIEIVPELGRRAANRCEALGYQTINFRIGDGYQGWPNKAPFDAIIVTAAPEQIPPALVEQLKVGGRLAIPVGKDTQELQILRKEAHGLTKLSSLDVRFVPMTGSAQDGSP